MDYEWKVQDLLERLREDETIFEISGTSELTHKVSELLNRVDWDDLWLNNINKVKQNNYNDMSGLVYELEAMGAKKDINSLLPPDTRFRFVKRVIRRMMYTITRDQEEYNNNVFKAISEVKRINSYLNLQIVRLEMDLEEKEKELLLIKKQLKKLEQQ